MSRRRGARLARCAGHRQTRFDAFVRDLPYPILRLIDLARALASDPLILLLDEITAALPADLSERVFEVVRQWRQRGRSGHLHFASHGGSRGALRPGDRASRRRRRRRDRYWRRKRRAHCFADARRREAGRGRAPPRPPGAHRGSRTSRRRSRCAPEMRPFARRRLVHCEGPARCWAWRRWRVRASRNCSIVSPACAAGRRRDLRRRPKADPPPSRRRDRGRGWCWSRPTDCRR